MKSKTMTICIVTRVTSAHSFGGMQHYVDLLAQGLALRGNKVIIISTALEGQHGEQVRRSDDGAVTTFFLANTRPGSYRRGFFKKAYKKILELNKLEKIDIVHGQSASAFACTGKLPMPVVTTLFGVGYCETPYQRLIYPKLSLKNKLYFAAKWPKIAVSMRYMYKAAEQSDEVILISRFSQDELRRVKPNFPHRKTTVIHCGVEQPEFDLKNKASIKEKLGYTGTLVLSAGRIEVQKGVQVLLDAWRGVDAPDAHLAVVGDGGYLPYLKEYAQCNKLKRCEFTGAVPHDRFLEYFAAADVFVYPELTRPAFGLVAAQAMTHGVPVIGANHGAIPEVIADAGFLCEPDNPVDLRDQLQYFLSHDDTWDFLRKKARQRVDEYFSVDRMVAQTLAVYRRQVKLKRHSS
ncbi:MAG: glycosyltransferase family 4 protein [Candidatus Auribacterota bacterium]|jgi:glycosyltransferase involved in cell wall biosynthesis|nr:glycosyltransferase family 4 protein [Candidatus Auribacterota bacterium]